MTTRTTPPTLPAPDTFAAYRQGRWVTVTLRAVHGHFVLAAAIARAPTADPADAVILDAWADATQARAAYSAEILAQTTGATDERAVAPSYGHAAAAQATPR